jgi:hypothetical protein
MLDLATELEKYSFPVEGIDDVEIVRALKLVQPLPSIVLKAPQLLVYYFGLTHPRFIMSYDKGMGKTIAYLGSLYADEPTKVVIVCSENAKLAQQREIDRHLGKWFGNYVFVEGPAATRKRQWNADADVFICTYDTLLADMGKRSKSSGTRICPPWVDDATTHMAFDEWHRKLRTKGSAFWNMLRGFNNRRMIFSSGSAGGKGVHSMWAVLHLCNKSAFPAYWPYVMRHSIVEETYFGKKLSGCRDRGKWRREVAPYIFHRRKDLKDYPPKTRQALDVRMEPWQKRAHNQLLKEMLMELPDGEYFASPNILAATMRLRQFMVCPKFISPDFGWGAGLEGIKSDAEDSELTHYVISTPFRGPIPLIEEYFRSHNIPVERLMGGDGCGHEEIAKRIARWTQKGGVMVQTIQFAESYELPAARVMYMLGYLHNPEQNSQAEDRIHRDLQSYDERIVEAMSGTADELHALMHAPLRAFIEEDL